MKTKSTIVTKTRWYFTCNSIEIDAHWNSFKSSDEAWKEFEHITHNIFLDTWCLVGETKQMVKYEVISL